MNYDLKLVTITKQKAPLETTSDLVLLQGEWTFEQFNSLSSLVYGSKTSTSYQKSEQSEVGPLPEKIDIPWQAQSYPNN